MLTDLVLLHIDNYFTVENNKYINQIQLKQIRYLIDKIKKLWCAYAYYYNEYTIYKYILSKQLPNFKTTVTYSINM